MRNAQTPLRSQGACPTQTGSFSALGHEPSGASFFPIGRRGAQTTGSGIRYLIAIDILRIHESRPVFTDAPHPESQLAISGDLARIEARYWLLLLGSGCVVGNPHLGIISELPVDRLVGILLLMQPDQEVISVWRDSARFWEKHREIIRQMFAPVTQALVEDGLIDSRHVVLDIATGPGEPALTIAALVGPEGNVFGIDHVPEMVEAARRATDHLGFRNAQFDVASADRLPFLPDTFDAVVSRFGVMFFPSPVDAVREMLRVLKPGRKLALAVWHFAERNPFFYTLQRIVERYVDWPSPAPDAADPFRFATPGKLRDLLGEAGAMAPCERLRQFTIQAPISVEDFWTL
jgi:ubiquinone/menaquinone biosynthesis C-methylase UbiE